MSTAVSCVWRTESIKQIAVTDSPCAASRRAEFQQGACPLSFLAEIHDRRKCCQISSFHSSLSLEQFPVDHTTWSSIKTLFPCAGGFQYKEFNFESVSVGYARIIRVG